VTSKVRLSRSGVLAEALGSLFVMIERRIKRSESPEEALQLLLEVTADRGALRALVLLNRRGRVLAGTGSARDVGGLARLTRATQRGEDYAELGELERGTDFFTTDFAVTDTKVTLAALGTRMLKMDEAVAGVMRIATNRAA
jgi:hypothetical protein